MTLSLAAPRAALPNVRGMWADAPGFTGLALFLMLMLVPLYAAMALDGRLFQGENPWLKPIKFHYALSIYLITLAFFARYMPSATLAKRAWRGFALAVCLAVTGEVVWLSSAAMLNTASHFNTTIPVFTAVYSLMGVLAVLLTSASAVMGIAIWRNPDSGLAPSLNLSVALGLVLTFVSTVIVAGYLSSNGTHFVGSSTRQIWLMGWSRDAGDLRVAHFLATHALHAVPLAGLLAVRTLPPAMATPAVWAACAAYGALIFGTFLQALNGQPFLPFIG